MNNPKLYICDEDDIFVCINGILSPEFDEYTCTVPTIPHA